MSNHHSRTPSPPAARRRGYSMAIPGLAACLLAAGWVQPASANTVTEFNAIAMSCIPRGGPATALDVALVAVAVHDAVQAIEKRYEPYFSAPPATGSESKAAAAAAAAYYVLSDDRVCPNTIQPTLDTAYAPYLAGNNAGLVVGKAAADALLATEYRAPTSAAFVPPVGIGQWEPTPPAKLPMAFVYVATLKPFVIDSPSQFRPGPPPALTSDRYAREYNEVKEKGGTLSHPATGACPAPADTDTARFWAGNFGAQWNQVLRDVAVSRQLGIGDTARLIALANLAAADSGIGIWDSKVHYNFWRPITAIAKGDADGNSKTEGDTSWVPFISSSHFPVGSQNPPYPDYLSGANGLTGAYTTMLQLFFRTDNLAFEIYKASPATVAICTNPRLYRRISDAAEEVVEARILLGIHFRSADTGARVLGTRVAWHVFNNALRPLRRDRHDWDRDDDHDRD
jgi:hypothetical protein